MHNGAVTDLGAADVFNIHPYAVVDAEVPKLSGFGQSSHAANLQPYQLGDVLALALYQVAKGHNGLIQNDRLRVSSRTARHCSKDSQGCSKHTVGSSTLFITATAS